MGEEKSLEQRLKEVAEENFRVVEEVPTDTGDVVKDTANKYLKASAILMRAVIAEKGGRIRDAIALTNMSLDVYETSRAYAMLGTLHAGLIKGSFIKDTTIK